MHRASFVLPLLGVLILGATSSSPLRAQGGQGAVTAVAPAWQPLSAAPQGRPSQAPVVMNAPASTTVAHSSVYYGVAPIYHSGGMMTTFLPQTSPSPSPSVQMGVATVNTGRPTIVPDQFMTPMVQTSNGLVAGTRGVVQPIPAPASAPMVATTSPAPAPTSVFPTLAPSYVPVPPVSTPAPTTVAQTPAPPTSNPLPNPPAAPTPAPATQPLADPNVFVSAGQEWMDIDLTPYTRDFAEGSGAERSVREWIVRKFDPSTWTGNQVSSLVVTPSHVKVYHNAVVQKSVCDLLVRFLYYKPGTFQSQVRVVATRESRWLNKYQSALLPAGQAGTSQRVWLVRGEDAKEMITDLGGGNSGSLLANPDAVVINGQHLTVDWSARPGQKSDPDNTGKPTQDGVLVTFSPLIDVDAATVELDLAAAVRRTVEAKSTWGGNRNEYRPNTSESQIKELVKIPPGQVVLASLGKVPDFDGGRNLWGQERLAEILVFVVCQPSPGNMVSGRPVEVAQANPIERSTAARAPQPSDLSRSTLSSNSPARDIPSQRSGVPQASRSGRSSKRLPPELTMSVD